MGERARDEAAGNRLCGADCELMARCHEIGEIIRQRELNIDLGIQDAEVDHGPGNELAPEGVGARYTEPAAGLMQAFARIEERRVKVTKTAAASSIERVSRFGQFHLACGAVKQRCTHMLLETADRAAYGGRTGAEFGCCSTKPAAIDDADECTEVGKER